MSIKEQSEAPKGANMPRKRNALGRGLSALMSAAAVSVDVANANKMAIQASGNAAPNLEVLEGRKGQSPAEPAASE